MAKKDKNGKWEYDEDDEERIAIAQEAMRRIQESNQPKPWDKTTERRGKEGKDRRAPVKDSKKKNLW